MTVTYKKLWHILIDRNMKKKDLQTSASLTHHTMLKLRTNQDITSTLSARYVKHFLAEQMTLWIL